MSVDPLTQSFPWYTPYQYAGNDPINYIDLDGLEKVRPVELFYKTTPHIDMSQAPAGSATNAAGIQRNGPWFWRKMLSSHPEMFSRDNIAQIKAGRSPIVDETWISFNSSHSAYKGNKLIHHHIDQGKMAAGIPEQVHYDFFSELHPKLRVAGLGLKMNAKGLLGSTLSFLGTFGDFFSFLNGNPDSWAYLYPCSFCDPKDDIGKVQKEPMSGLYFTIKNVAEEKYSDGSMKSRTISYDIYSSYIWDESKEKYIGIDKIDSRSETISYDKSGNIIENNKGSYRETY